MACPGSLTTISIPESVTRIGTSAFNGCTDLTTISIPQGVTSVGDYAFCHCRGLTTVSIPQGVTSIGYSALVDCTGLTTIRFNSKTTTIYDYADTIPDTTKIIGYDPSTAKTYATKYNREFEVIGATKPLKSISVDPSTLNLSTDETSDTITLTATYTDNTTEDVTDSATWTSKNPSVATVDTAEGIVITGVANGSTTITGAYGGKTATITVNVH